MKIVLDMKLDDLNLHRDHIYTGDKGEGKYIPGARASFNLRKAPRMGSYGRGQDQAALTIHIHDVEAIEELLRLHHEAVMRDFPSEPRAYDNEDQIGRIHFTLTLETAE